MFLYQFIKILQYGTLYFILSLGLGINLNHYIPDLNDHDSYLKIIAESLIICLLICVLVFLIRKIVSMIPFIFENKTSNCFNYNGEVMFSLVFFSTQVKLIDRLHWLIKKKQKIELN